MNISGPESRDIQNYLNHGLVIINKPCGPSSHQVSGWLRRILGVEKTGHFGTLDPEVSGVLPVALGVCTKLAPYFMKKDKEYVGIMRFHNDISENEVKALFSTYLGKIKQLPPVRSAVARKIRQREIYKLEFLEMNGRDVLFKVSCEAGTYVRKLCHDLGKTSGKGAHMTELRRTKAGNFHEKNACLIQDVSDAKWLADKGNESELRQMVLPIENVLSLKKIWVKDSAVDAVCSGAQLAKPGILKFDDFHKGDKIAIVTLKNELIAIAEAILDSKDLEKMNKGQVSKTERVIMLKGEYPKMWGEKNKGFKD